MSQAILNISAARGYSADQAEEATSVTLGDLLCAIENAIDLLGEDAVVVTRDESNQYGATFGTISSGDIFDLVKGPIPTGSAIQDLLRKHDIEQVINIIQDTYDESIYEDIVELAVMKLPSIPNDDIDRLIEGLGISS